MKKWQKALVGLLVGVGMTFAVAGCDDGLTVTFMDGDKKVEIMTDLEKDKPIKLPDAPKKDGYTFVGWYTDSALTKPYEQDSAVTKNMTLYAKYTRSQLYVIINLNYQSQTSIEPVKVTYGEPYELPKPEREGYTFTGWTLNGNPFDASGDAYTHENSITVYAQWSLNKYTVTYKDGEQTLGTKTVEHGQAVEAWTEVAAGYQIDGIFTDSEYQTAYDQKAAVKGDLTLYVKKSPKTFKITVNRLADGDNKDTTAQFGGTYTLQEPTREGYDFLYYTYNGNEFPLTGTYSWTENITIVAEWKVDPDYNKREVFFFDGASELKNLRIKTEKGETITLPTAPAKDGYTFKGWYTEKELTNLFDEETVIDDDLALFAKYQANTYKLTLDNDGDATYDGTKEVVFGQSYSLIAPKKEGFKFTGYTTVYDGEPIAFPLVGVYNYPTSLILKATWEEIPEDEEETTSETFIAKDTDKYYKERKTSKDEFTFVFFKDTAYALDEYTKIVFSGADGLLTGVDGVKFTPTAVGEFQITFTRTTADGDTVVFTRNAKIVNKVTALELQADYNATWATTENRAKTFINEKATAIMAVGASNFQAGLDIGGGDEHYDYDSGNIQVSVKVGETPSNDFTVENGVIHFGSSLVGQTVKLTFAPKYPRLDGVVLDPVSMTVQVNDGVNVYTSADLRKAYADTAVKTINVLRNITAELPEGDYADLVKGAPLNAYEFGAFRRITHVQTDSVVVNGNFFQIDASKLPLVDNRYDNRGKWAVEGTSGYYVNEVQVGIFLYWNTLNNSGDRKDYHTGQLTVNDLSITGNYIGAADLKGDNIDNKPILKNSGSWNGIVCRGGTVNVNNANIQNVNVGFFSDGGISASDATQQSVQYNLNEVRVKDVWNSTIYLYNLTKLTVRNSEFGQGNAASITVDDVAQESSCTLDIEVDVDTATTFKNWISGEEAWFVAYGMKDTAAYLKGTIEQGFTDRNLPLTIIKNDGVEKMNLTLFVRSAGKSETGDWVNDNRKKPFVKHNFTMFDYPTVLPNADDKVYFNFENGEYVSYMYGVVELMTK